LLQQVRHAGVAVDCTSTTSLNTGTQAVLQLQHARVDPCGIAVARKVMKLDYRQLQKEQHWGLFQDGVLHNDVLKIHMPFEVDINCDGVYH